MAEIEMALPWPLPNVRAIAGRKTWDFEWFRAWVWECHHSKDPVENKGNTKNGPSMGVSPESARNKPNAIWFFFFSEKPIICFLWSLSKISRRAIQCRSALYYLLMYSPYKRIKSKQLRVFSRFGLKIPLSKKETQTKPQQASPK